MAKTTMKFKEADPITGDQMIDQNVAPVSAVPASNADVNQATSNVQDPAQDIIQPADDLNADVPADEGLQVNPETVGMQVQIPTDQLASAVAMATGDVTAAETAPDAQMAQEDDLVASQEDEAEAPVEAPVDGVNQAAPEPNLNQQNQVFESKKVNKKLSFKKKLNEKRVTVECSNIEWDCDPDNWGVDPDDDAFAIACGNVPEEAVVTVEYDPETDDLQDVVFQALSDEYGLFPVGCGVEILNESKKVNKKLSFKKKLKETNGLSKKDFIATIEEIRKSIEDEHVSWGEIAFLQDNHSRIRRLFPCDVELYQWAGISEDVYDRDCEKAYQGSQRTVEKKSYSKRIESLKEAIDAPDKESDAVEKKMEGDLEDIITTGVQNVAKGLSNGKPTINSENKENELDIIKTGVENMGKELKESEEDIPVNEVPEDEPVDDEPEEKLDFSKLASDVSDEPGDSELPPPMEDDNDLGDAEVDSSIFDDIDTDEMDDFMNKMGSFLSGDDAKPVEVADSLRTAADFIDSVTDDSESEESAYEDEDLEDDEFEDIDDEPIEDDEDEKFNFNDLVAGAYEEDDFDDEPVEDDLDDEIEESLVRVPCKFPKRNAIKESKSISRPVSDTIRKPVEKVVESTSSIKYPAGSDPNEKLVERNQNLVEAHERVVNARRNAINRFRESVRRDQEEDRRIRNPRFNEALRNSVRLSERSRNTNSWDNNKFADRYEESSKLDFKKLLNEGYLG